MKKKLLITLLRLAAPIWLGLVYSDDTEAARRFLLRLDFNNSLTGKQGESPVQATAISFENGIEEQGVYISPSTLLTYNAAGEIIPEAGTIEFWIKPRWNGNDNMNHAFFAIGNQVLIIKDAANNFRFLLRTDDSEGHKGRNLSHWVANEWHHIAVTWTVPGVMKTYFDGEETISHPSSNQDLINITGLTMSIGSRAGQISSDAVIDELRISNHARPADVIARDYVGGLSISSLTVESAFRDMFTGWLVKTRLKAVTNIGQVNIPTLAAEWSTSNPFVATVDESGRIKAISPGVAAITAEVNTVEGDFRAIVREAARPSDVETIDEFLATPAARNLWEIPVVIIKYIPTRDGINVDQDVADYEGTVETLRDLINQDAIKVKYMLEEGSRYHGYKDSSARPVPPSIGYRVVHIETVYEDIPPGFDTGTPDLFFPDYNLILQKLGAENFVRRLGVKEFWFWGYHHGPIVPVESNMSSPLTGDISNSHRFNDDMPIYNSTYTLYNYNFTRGPNEAVHDHGHQIEALLLEVNRLQDGTNDLFWKKFVGVSQTGQHITGRCGWTHMPPNTVADYDYENMTPVLSDIEDWTPDGRGEKTMVNALTWGSLPYAPPYDTPPALNTESKWYIYWMQNIPGRNNGIKYGDKAITNWWAFTGDWDESIKSGMRLIKPWIVGDGSESEPFEFKRH